MPFQFSESLRTGIEALDADHRALIDDINRIEAAEQNLDAPALMKMMSEFRASLAGHFREEENQLRSVGYPRRDAHSRHHAETLVTLDRLIRDMEAGQPIDGGVANACFHEVVSAVLLQDMRFLNWLADHPGAARQS